MGLGTCCFDLIWNTTLLAIYQATMRMDEPTNVTSTRLIPDSALLYPRQNIHKAHRKALFGAQSHLHRSLRFCSFALYLIRNLLLSICFL